MSNSWMPPKGRRSVIAGTSLTRALSARKAKGAVTPSKSLYTRDFYSFRYNFRPPSVDPGERGRIIVKKGQDSTRVTVERPSTQPGEAHQWLGTEDQAKEWDCVLIYDEVSDTYTLEKLDSNIRLTHQHKPIAFESTTSTPPIQSPAVKVKKATAAKYEEELERELMEAATIDVDEDMDAEGDDDFDDILPSPKPNTHKREEEEEEEGEDVVMLPPPPPPPQPKATKPPRVTKSAPHPPAPPAPAPAPASVSVPPTTAKAHRQPAAVPPPARPKVPLPGSQKKKPKRETEAPTTMAVAPIHSTTTHINDLADADAEDLEFGVPAKRARTTLPSSGLALPSSSTSASDSFFTPPPPPPPPAITLTPPEAGSDSEEDWDEVVDVGTSHHTHTHTSGTHTAHSVATDDDFDIFGDDAHGDEEDIDMNELEREINLHMDEVGSDADGEDDFLAAVVEHAPPSRGQPVSLKQLALSGSGGVPAYTSEDEYSSSEESDDD